MSRLDDGLMMHIRNSTNKWSMCHCWFELRFNQLLKLQSCGISDRAHRVCLCERKKKCADIATLILISNVQYEAYQSICNNSHYFRQTWFAKYPEWPLKSNLKGRMFHEKRLSDSPCLVPPPCLSCSADAILHLDVIRY